MVEIVYISVWVFVTFGAVFSIIKHRKTSKEERGKRTAWLVYSILFGIMALPFILVLLFVIGICTGIVPIM